MLQKRRFLIFNFILVNIIEKLNFKGKWKIYQKRVLDELNSHLDDSKLNVVAAPGVGKTTLGIEVLLRLKNSAFILAPTITIKKPMETANSG